MLSVKYLTGDGRVGTIYYGTEVSGEVETYTKRKMDRVERWVVDTDQ